VSGESLNVEPVPAACSTRTVRPATVSVPVLIAVVGFAGAEMRTNPSPEPLAPETIVIHDVWLCAVHAHWLSTRMSPTPPAPGAENALGST
jgi:hypothetical protein